MVVGRLEFEGRCAVEDGFAVDRSDGGDVFSGAVPDEHSALDPQDHRQAKVHDE